MKAKRISILALVVIMALLIGVFAVAPFSAMAEEITEVWNWNELLNAVNSDKLNIKLMANIEDVVPDDELPTKHRLVFNGGFEYVLDLNGHSLTVLNHANEFFSEGFSMIEVSNSSSLEMKNGTAKFENYFINHKRTAKGVVFVKDDSTFFATKVTMKNTYLGVVVSATDTAKVTLDGCECCSLNGFALYLERQASLTLDGGCYIHTEIGDATPTVYMDGYGALYSESTGDLVINNAVFKTGVQVNSAQKSAFDIAKHEVTINDEVLSANVFDGTQIEATNAGAKYYWYSYNQCSIYRTADSSFTNTVKVISLDKKYPINIANGVAKVGGVQVAEASYGQEVTIIANTPEEGMEFVRWDGSALVENAYSATTTFTMPATPVTLTAYYGNESVKSVELAIDTPVVGEKIKDAKVVVDGDVIIGDVEWFANEVRMDENASFFPGQIISVEVLVYPPDGYRFKTPLDIATVNGNNATVYGTEGYASISYTFNQLPGNPFAVIYNNDTTQLGIGGKIELDTATMATQSNVFKDALDAGEVSYQWYKNGDVIEGETNARYDFKADDVDGIFYAVVTAGDEVAWGQAHYCYNYLYQIYLNATDVVAGGKAPQISSATPGVAIDSENMTISTLIAPDTYSSPLSLENVIIVPGKSYRLSGRLLETSEANIPYLASCYVNGELMAEAVDGLAYFFYDFTAPTADFPVYYTANGEIGIGVTLTIDVERMRTENGTFKNAYDHANATYQTVFYQWYKNGEPINGATSSDYTVKTADKNSLIHCGVTLVDGKRGIGEQFAISNVITMIKLTMPIPKGGNVKISTTNSDIYADGINVVGLMWFHKDTDYTMQGGDTYIEGDVYTYYIQIEATDGFLLDFTGSDLDELTKANIYGEEVLSGGSSGAIMFYIADVTALHTHHYSDLVWAYDDEYHWQPCIEDGCPNPHEEEMNIMFHYGTEATCQTQGHCSVCNYVYYGEHDFSVPDYQYVDDMICATYCANCDEIGSWSYHSGGVTTCQSKSECEWCHQEYGKLADHAGGTATCYEKAICSTCGEEYGDLLDHDWSEGWDYKDANGHAHLCENSGCTAHDSIIPHTPNIANPTEEEAKVCTVCEYVIAPRLNHVHALTPVSATPATCTENGNTAYYTCNCGQWFSDSEGNNLIVDHSSVIIPATNHNYEGVAWSSDANEHYKVCKNTNCSEKGEVATHTPNIDNPTEEEAKVCTVCQYVIAPALNHVHALTPVVAKGATCTENGNVAYYTCTCGQWFSDENATNLIDNHDSVIVVASGHTDANTDGTCDTCGWVDPNFTPVVPGPGGGEGTPEPTPDNTPDTTPEGEDEAGLSGGAIAGIAVGATVGAVGLGVGGFAIFWFVIKKKKFADLIALFKKK